MARPILDYWLLQREKSPVRPQHSQISGGLMTAGIKPGELPSGSSILSADPSAHPATPAPATNTPATTSIERD